MRTLPGRFARAVQHAIEIVWSAAERFFEDRAPESAASMSFYVIFSFFPALLLLAIVGQLIIGALGLQDDALGLLLAAFPPAFSEFLRRSVVEVLGARGAAVGAASLLVLGWAATSGLATLAVTLNRAWGGGRPIGALKARLRALAVIGCLVGFLAVLLLARAASRLVPILNAALGSPIKIEVMGNLHSGVPLFLLVFATLLLLYRLVPSRRVGWFPAMVGALLASAASWVVTWGFTWYLGSGLETYRLIYGSLGVPIAFLTWVYALTMIVLAGAYAGAAVADGRPVRPRTPVAGGAPLAH
jgi:membrane protein